MLTHVASANVSEVDEASALKWHRHVQCSMFSVHILNKLFGISKFVSSDTDKLTEYLTYQVRFLTHIHT